VSIIQVFIPGESVSLHFERYHGLKRELQIVQCGDKRSEDNRVYNLARSRGKYPWIILRHRHRDTKKAYLQQHNSTFIILINLLFKIYSRAKKRACRKERRRDLLWALSGEYLTRRRRPESNANFKTNFHAHFLILEISSSKIRHVETRFITPGFNRAFILRCRLGCIP